MYPLPHGIAGDDVWQLVCDMFVRGGPACVENAAPGAARMSRARLADLRAALTLLHDLRVVLDRLDFDWAGLPELRAIEGTLLREQARYQNREEGPPS